jgi:chromate reductase
MSQHRIAVLVGSLRKESINRRLATAIAALAPKEFSFDPLRIDDLPAFNQDEEKQPAASVTRLKAAIRGADGVLFVTPEYNRSIPGVLKNALDQASRPYGDSAWAGKPAGVMGASQGAPGTSMAQQHLRNILAYLDMPTLNQPEVYLQVKDGMFDPSGALVDDETRKFLGSWVEKFTKFVTAHSGAK